MSDRRTLLAELLERTAAAVRAAPAGNSLEWREAERMAADAGMFARQIGEVEGIERRDPMHLPTDFDMAQLGWSVETSVDTRGSRDPFCTVRVERWSWHGEFTDRVCFSASCRRQEDIPDARDRAVRVALQAWHRYREPGCPPMQGRGGLSRDKFREGIRAHVLRGKTPTEAGKVMTELHHRLMDDLPLFDEEAP